MNINVKYDFAKVNRLYGGGKNSPARKAITAGTVSALNVVAKVVQRESAREITRKYNLKQKDIIAKKGQGRSETGLIRLERANKTKLYSRIVAGGQPISLRLFGATQKTVRLKRDQNPRNAFGRTRKGVSLKVLKTGRKRVIKGLFQTRPDGPVFRRTSSAQLPIAKQSAKRLPKMFTEQAVQTAQRRAFDKRWAREFDKQVQFRLNKLA